MSSTKKKIKQKSDIKHPSGTRGIVIPEKWWFIIFIGLLSIGFYANTIKNHYALDDYLVVENNESVDKGFSGIPEILTSRYTNERSNSFGYRPVAQISFAIEKQFTGELAYGSNISHLINVLLYLFAVMLLYKLLLRLLKNYNPWIPFLITVFFLAHPMHTEVVASLKNREILFEFIFSILAISSLVTWAETEKAKGLILGLVYYLLALLSKETAIAQLAIFPLVLFFFTPAKPRQIKTVIIFGVVVLIAAVLVPRMLLPEMNRNFRLMENPLFVEENFFVRMATALYILLYYVKLLLIPFPMRYYYGYNMIPLTNWADPLVWLSLVFHLFLLYWAIKGFMKKSVLSFFILFYFVNIAMYSNIVFPVPGIVGERFLFFSSISFAALLAFAIGKISRLNVRMPSTSKSTLALIILIGMVIVVPYGYLTINRNSEWRSQLTLTRADIRKLSNSVKANDLYANELMKQVNAELSKPVNPYKFILPLIERATIHYKQALTIDSTHWSSWNNLGLISSKIHASQSMLRSNSLYNKGDSLKAREEFESGEKEFYRAIDLFKKALKFKPDFDAALFNIGYAFDQLQLTDSSIFYYRKSIEISPEAVNTRSRLANALFQHGQLEEAIRENMKITEIDPISELPYVNLGNYYYINGDTAEAMRYFAISFEKMPRPEVAKLLADYFAGQGDREKAAFYQSAVQKTKN